MVNINENYINYIQSNPKLVLPMDDLAVADTVTTGHYLTLDTPRSNNKKGFPSAPHPDAKWGSHKIYAHSTPVSPRPAASSTTSTYFPRAHEYPAVHWDIV